MTRRFLFLIKAALSLAALAAWISGLTGTLSAAPIVVYGYEGQTQLDPNPSGMKNRPGFPLGFSRATPVNELSSFDYSPPTGNPLIDFYDFYIDYYGLMVGTGELYGQFTRGFIEAPVTGDYKFYVRSDDKSQFFLSTDETVENERMIAQETGCCHGWSEDGGLSSTLIHLERGKKYFFEIFHLEVGLFGPEYFQVGWKRPDGVFEGPIPGRHLWNYPSAAFLTNPPVTPPPVLVVQPTNTVATERDTVAFSIVADAMQPASVQWRKGGTPIQGAILSYLEVGKVTVANDNEMFDVVITNPGGSITSAPVRLTVLADKTPPLIQSAITWGNPNGVDVTFSEAVSDDGLLNKANYTIDNSVTVSDVIRVGPASVRLKTSTLREGVAYAVSAMNIKDTAAAPNSSLSPVSKTFYLTHGAVTRKLFFSLDTSSFLDSLTGDGRFTGDTPDEIDFPENAESPPDFLENYGARVQGYFTPPVTGPYLFFLCSADEGKLFLSTDSNPANKTQIAWEPVVYGRMPQEVNDNVGELATRNVYLEWLFGTGIYEVNRIDSANPAGTPSNISKPVVLTAGQKYYFEALMKTGPTYGWPTHLEINWLKPGDRPVINGDRPIGPEYLTAYGKPFAPISITKQPKDLSVNELGSARFTVSVDGSPGYFFQWLANGKPIPGATKATLSLDSVTRTNHQDQYSVIVSNHFSSLTSQPAELLVNFDGIPPALLSAAGSPTLDRVLLTFSEPIDYSSGSQVTNYSIAGLEVIQANVLFGDTNVVLTTAPQTPGASYGVLVNHVLDRSAIPNEIAPDSSAAFHAWQQQPGLLRVDYYHGLPGESVDDFKFNPNFPDGWDEIDYISSFSFRGPAGVHDYGVRVSGFVSPPVSGNYKFYIRSRAGSELNFSFTTNGSEASTMAREPLCCNPFMDGTQSTAPLTLEAGKKYYIEALLKVGGTDGYVEVAWKQASDATPPGSLTPIGGAALSTFVDPDQPPQSATESLTILRLSSEVEVSWPGDPLLWTLQSRNPLQGPGTWQDVPMTTRTNRVRFPLQEAPRFFRLKR